MQATGIGSKLKYDIAGQYFEIPISKWHSFLHEHLPSYKWKEHKETVQKKWKNYARKYGILWHYECQSYQKKQHLRLSQCWWWRFMFQGCDTLLTGKQWPHDITAHSRWHESSINICFINLMKHRWSASVKSFTWTQSIKYTSLSC